MNQSLLAVYLGKLISLLTQSLNLGGGSAAPGLYALKLNPNLITFFSSQIQTNIIITGTNGKTTTASLLDHSLRKNGITTIRNKTGSNLERGIASSMLKNTNFLGMLPDTEVGIWEVDEAAFNTVAPKIHPRIIVFLNAFRDQLDRYGEVDSVVSKWQKTLAGLAEDTLIIANGDDENTVQMISKIPQKSLFYGIDGQKITGEKKPGKHQPVKLTYSASDVIPQGLEGSVFDFKFNGHSTRINFALAGLYQIYNFLASAAVLHNLNIDTSKLSDTLSDFSAPFGRAEKVTVHGKECTMMLIKNPLGATSVFETLRTEFKDNDGLLLALNDNFADGTDVSWIWDAEFEKLNFKNQKLKIMCSGTRAYDLAVRLKYSGIKTEIIEVEPDLQEALTGITAISDRVFILPTYTALLQLQKLLTKTGVKKHYWREN